MLIQCHDAVRVSANGQGYRAQAVANVAFDHTAHFDQHNVLASGYVYQSAGGVANVHGVAHVACAVRTKHRGEVVGEAGAGVNRQVGLVYRQRRHRGVVRSEARAVVFEADNVAQGQYGIGFVAIAIGDGGFQRDEVGGLEAYSVIGVVCIRMPQCKYLI